MLTFLFFASSFSFFYCHTSADAQVWVKIVGKKVHVVELKCLFILTAGVQLGGKKKFCTILISDSTFLHFAVKTSFDIFHANRKPQLPIVLWEMSTCLQTAANYSPRGCESVRSAT